MRYLRYIGVILCGIGLTSLFCYFSYTTGEDNIHRDIDSHNSVILDIVVLKFRTDVNSTFLPNALGTIASTHPFPNREVFQNFSIPSLDKQSTRIIHFFIKITPEYRQEYIDEMTLQYPELESFDIFDISVDGVKTVSGPDDTMWPSTHVSIPSATRLIGLNFYSFAADLIDRMIEVNHPIFSDIFTLPALTEVPMPRTSVLVLQPVYVRNEIYGLVMDFVSMGYLIRQEVEISSPDVDFDISSIMIFKGNINGGYDTLFDFTEDPELDHFLIQGYTLEYAKSRGKYCSVLSSVVDNSVFISVLCTNESVSYLFIFIPIVIGALCTSIVYLTLFSLQKDSDQKKTIARTKEIEINRKSDFLSEMTHELRTPLNGIMGMCDMLNYSSNMEETSEFLCHIKSGGKMLRNIIDNILEFSKVEAGKLNFRPTYENLISTVESICSLVVASYIKPSSTIEPVSFKLHIDQSVPEGIYTDHSRLKQILTNLISNALKFTDKGCISVNMYATNLHNTSILPSYMKKNDIELYDMKYILHIDVKDSGIGMSEENRKKLFQTFSQVHTDRSVGGSGLGLVVCKKICEDMGGDILCESVLGEGTTFLARFVIVSNIGGTHTYEKSWELVEIKRRESNNISIEHTKESSKALSVMIVDDFPLNIKLLRRIMEKNNVSVMSCGNGKDAVDLSMKHKFDIIFIDFHMPIMNGSDATIAIRKNWNNPNCKTNIIVLTGSEEKSSESLKISGVNKVILKPFNIKEIIQIIATERMRETPKVTTKIEPDGDDRSRALSAPN